MKFEKLETRALLTTVATGFEGISSNDFTIPTAGSDTAQFHGDASSGSLGIAHLYRNGAYAWMVDPGGTGLVQFSSPADSVLFYARLRNNATQGSLVITAFNALDESIGSSTISDPAAAFQQINFPSDVSRIEFVNTTDQIVSIDDFTSEVGSLPNQKPSFTASDPPTVNEDTGAQSVNGFASFDPGDPSESSQSVLAYHVSNVSRPDLFAALPAIDVDGNLTYTLAADAFGTSTFTATVQDNGGAEGGGMDTSDPQVFTVTVNPINDQPTFSIDGPVAVNEDAGPQSVVDFASNFDPGPMEDGASTASRILQDEGVDGTTNPLSTDNTNPTDLGPLSHGSNIIRGFIEAAKTVGNVDVFTFTIETGFQLDGLLLLEYEYVTPPQNPNERAAFLAIDDTDSFPYNAFDLDINLNPFLDETAYIGGTVFGLDNLPGVGPNDILPSAGVVTGSGFTPPLPAGTYTIYIQQTGPANRYALDFRVTETTKQTVLAYSIDNLSNPALFSSPPQIDQSGTLNFTPAADANGVATFEVTVQDNGGTDGGGEDISIAIPGTITIASVNDRPTFLATDPPAVLQDSGPHLIEGFVTNFDPGPDDESTQNLVAYNVTNLTSAALFSSPPAIDSNGDLSYTPAPGAFGTATFDVSVQDSGGTENGGNNVSFPTTITITIEQKIDHDFGDAPDSYPVTLADDGARHVVGPLFLGATIDAESDGQPSAGADLDGSDEDGVTPRASIVTVVDAATITSFQIVASASGLLDAWIDFDGDNQWDPSEQIAQNIAVSAGSNTLSVAVPAQSTIGTTAARFRLSSAGDLTPMAAADDGEVEDYLLTIIDGGVSPNIEVDLVGTTGTIVAESGNVFVRGNPVDLFSAPLHAIGLLTVDGTNSSDTFTIDFSGGDIISNAGLRINGREGDNVLRLVGDGEADLAGGDVSASSFATIDMTDPATHEITMDPSVIQSLAPATTQVSVRGGEEDTIRFTNPTLWRMGDPSIVEGRFLRPVIQDPLVGGAETLVTELPHAWQNVIQPSDANNDGEVSAGDALVIINELDRRSFSDRTTGALDDPLGVEAWPGIYYDQSGDDEASAFDALRVINELARQGAPASEAVVFDVALRQLLELESKDDANADTDAVIPSTSEKVASFRTPTVVIRSLASTAPDAEPTEQSTSHLDDRPSLINEKHPAW